MPPNPRCSLPRHRAFRDYPPACRWRRFSLIERTLLMILAEKDKSVPFGADDSPADLAGLFPVG
jgi:hypothetical protein